MRTRMQNDEVLFAMDDIRSWSALDVFELETKALASPTGKLRICLHRSPEDEVHEMLIAMRKDVKYPAHSHPSKEESYFIVKGKVRFFLFDSNGKMTQEIPMGDCTSGLASYLRLPAGIIHRFDIETDICVFLETKLGPFNAADNEYLTSSEKATENG